MALGAAPASSGTAALDCQALAATAPASAEALQAALRDARDHGYLWRISKDGRSSWLFGTFHVGRLEWMFPGPTLQRALRDADVLALELDPLDPQVQAQLARGIAAMPHTPLPEALQQRLRAAAAALCVPYETIASYAPEFQVVALGTMVGRPLQLEAQYGADLGLSVYARRMKQEILSLETPEGQLQALQMHDADETVAYVEDSLQELEPGASTALLARMARAWAGGDGDELEHYAQWCRCLDTPIERTVMARLLDQRNPGLAEAIDRAHRSGKRVFAAIGSLHLFGPSGLPALMTQRGYRVERVALHQP
jgi:uncharacterized protein YbaP (TraB family)